MQESYAKDWLNKWTEVDRGSLEKQGDCYYHLFSVSLMLNPLNSLDNRFLTPGKLKSSFYHVIISFYHHQHFRIYFLYIISFLSISYKDYIFRELVTWMKNLAQVNARSTTQFIITEISWGLWQSRCLREMGISWSVTKLMNILDWFDVLFFQNYKIHGNQCVCVWSRKTFPNSRWMKFDTYLTLQC